MSKKYVEAEYAEINEMENENGQVEIVQIPKRNLLHKLADLADSAGDKMDERRKAKAEKKAAKEVIEDDEGETNRRKKFKKIAIGGLAAAALTGVAALALSRMSRDQELVTLVPDEGADEFDPDELGLQNLEEADEEEQNEDIEVQNI